MANSRAKKKYAVLMTTQYQETSGNPLKLLDT